MNIRNILPLVLMFYIPQLLKAQFVASDFDQFVESVQAFYEVPGIAIGIVRNDSVIYAKGFGSRTMNQQEPVDIHTNFAIASLSKAYTTGILGRLVDQKKLKWSDKVIDHLPWFQTKDAYVTREMTVKDLVSHRAGYLTFSGDLLWWGSQYSKREVVERLKFLEPKYSFRSEYGYQNILFIAAGEVIEAVSGVSWESWVQDSILAPLKMDRTTVSISELSSLGNVATPHMFYNDKLEMVPYRNLDNCGPAASLNSNVDDLTHWMRMWLKNDGFQLVSKEMKHVLWHPVTPLNLSLRAYEYLPKRHARSAALGWFTMDYHGYKIVNHSGGMDGMISFLALIPEKKLGLVILTNSVSSAYNPIFYTLLDKLLETPENRDWLEREKEFMKTVKENEKKEEAERQASRVKHTKPSLALSKYTGTYRSELYGDVEVTEKNKQLYISFLPSPSLKGLATHWHFDTFELTVEDKTLPKGFASFILNAKGDPEELKIDIPNPDFWFWELKLLKVK